MAYRTIPPLALALLLATCDGARDDIDDSGTPCVSDGPERCDGLDNDCDGLVDEGFDFASDAAHCGYCGNVCQSLSGCLAGRCVPDTCDAGFADCDGDPRTPCETELAADTDHCGQCDHLCAADGASESTCALGHCAVLRCAAERADCDGRFDNGCEQEVGSDARHCGACDVSCESWQACVAGRCVMAPCPVGTVDLDAVPDNGCECVITDLPGEVDTFDPEGLDTNCDGVDGDASIAIYVSLSGRIDGVGTPTDPTSSVPAGLELARAQGKSLVYVSAGDFWLERRVILADGIALVGGFDPVDWRQGAGTTMLFATGLRNYENRETVAIDGVDLTRPTRVADLSIHAASPPGFVQQGGSSFALRCQRCPGLILERLELESEGGGRGSDGWDGLQGIRGAGGETGDSIACNNSTGGKGGDGSDGGGDGGDGADEPNPDSDGRDGRPGEDGDGPLGGEGGEGGRGSNDSSEAGEYGDYGRRGGHGAAGTPGSTPSDPRGRIASGSWGGQGGGDGGRGQTGGGGGGGGGGGSGARDVFGDTDSASGGGGGGGGGGGTGGFGGSGGGPGGASVAVLLIDSSGASLAESRLKGGVGGLGGAGGLGGFGGRGGEGGWYGYGCIGESGRGGPGGNGGDGGQGGRGGGGAGGVSYALYLVRTTLATDPRQSGNTFVRGVGGPGAIAGEAAEIREDP